MFTWMWARVWRPNIDAECLLHCPPSCRLRNSLSLYPELTTGVALARVALVYTSGTLEWQADYYTNVCVGSEDLDPSPPNYPDALSIEPPPQALLTIPRWAPSLSPIYLFKKTKIEEVIKAWATGDMISLPEIKFLVKVYPLVLFEGIIRLDLYTFIQIKIHPELDHPESLVLSVTKLEDLSQVIALLPASTSL